MVLPYKNSEKGKKAQVTEMFNNISGSYDFLNHTLSIGIDKIWRKKVINILKKHRPSNILDIATGTADFAIQSVQLKPNKIIGIDISEGMLNIGKQKIIKKKLNHLIKLQVGDSENLNFEDNSFDAITTGFGVRNFENLDKGLAEMYRVLKPGGINAVLEFSMPRKFPVKQLYNFYFLKILPFLGRIISKDQAAYTYLPESVKAFPEGEHFLEHMKTAGFKNLKVKSLGMGIASIYTGEKA